MTLVTKEEFQAELEVQIASAQSQGFAHIDIKAGELHRAVGDYPDSRKHRMPVCCDAMRSHMQPNDEVISEPKKDNGASVIIRYILPR